jgi:hypothetical protein
MDFVALALASVAEAYQNGRVRRRKRGMVGKPRRRAVAVAASCAAASGSILLLTHGAIGTHGGATYFLGGLGIGAVAGLAMVAVAVMVKRGKSDAC